MSLKKIENIIRNITSVVFNVVLICSYLSNNVTLLFLPYAMIPDSKMISIFKTTRILQTIKLCLFIVQKNILKNKTVLNVYCLFI